MGALNSISVSRSSPSTDTATSFTKALPETNSLASTTNGDSPTADSDSRSKEENGAIERKLSRASTDNSIADVELDPSLHCDVKVIVSKEPRTVMVARVECSVAEKDKMIQQLLKRCKELIDKQKGKIVGPPFACIHNHRGSSGTMFTLDAGYPVEGSLHGNDQDINIFEFPPATVAQLVHMGPNDGEKLSPAYAYLKAWAAQHHRKREKEYDPWQDYLTPPGVTDPREFRTAINLPIKS